MQTNTFKKIYITGDTHGSFSRIERFCEENQTTTNDLLIILGDAGINYYLDERDTTLKHRLSKLPITLLCIHGNHEERPENIPTYSEIDFCGDKAYAEREFPNLIFAKDGSIYNLNGARCLILGRAYSVDKYYRLMRGYRWWPDEQPSDAIKAYVEEQVKENRQVDVVLSHTCPFKYEPVEAFLPMINQDTVDDSTEHWLDEIEEQLAYDAWMCGHWHINKRIDKLHFLFHDFEAASQLNLSKVQEDGGPCDGI